MTTKIIATNENIHDLVHEALLSNLHDFQECGKVADLNYIDVSQVTDTSFLFCGALCAFDISKWDVSNVTNMYCMFADCKFNFDVSNWCVDMVNDITDIFKGSMFHGDISKWNIKDSCRTDRALHVDHDNAFSASKLAYIQRSCFQIPYDQEITLDYMKSKLSTCVMVNLEDTDEFIRLAHTVLDLYFGMGDVIYGQQLGVAIWDLHQKEHIGIETFDIPSEAFQF